MAEIEKKILKQSKRNVVSRHLHAKNDKEKIASWKSDLGRILQVFNVRPIISVLLLLTLDPQTELAINTHVTVSEIHQGVVNTHAIVSDIHRTMVKGQEVADGRNLLVSDTDTLPTTE